MCATLGAQSPRRPLLSRVLAVLLAVQAVLLVLALGHGRTAAGVASSAVYGPFSAGPFLPKDAQNVLRNPTLAVEWLDAWRVTDRLLPSSAAVTSANMLIGRHETDYLEMWNFSGPAIPDVARLENLTARFSLSAELYNPGNKVQLSLRRAYVSAVRRAAPIMRLTGMLWNVEITSADRNSSQVMFLSASLADPSGWNVTITPADLARANFSLGATCGVYPLSQDFNNGVKCYFHEAEVNVTYTIETFVSGVSRSVFSTAGGEPVRVFGGGFHGLAPLGNSTCVCMFNTTRAPALGSVLNASALDCVVPAHPAGVVFLEVSCDNTTFTANRVNVSFRAADSSSSATLPGTSATVKTSSSGGTTTGGRSTATSTLLPPSGTGAAVGSSPPATFSSTSRATRGVLPSSAVESVGETTSSGTPSSSSSSSSRSRSSSDVGSRPGTQTADASSMPGTPAGTHTSATAALGRDDGSSSALPLWFLGLAIAVLAALILLVVVLLGAVTVFAVRRLSHRNHHRHDVDVDVDVVDDDNGTYASDADGKAPPPLRARAPGPEAGEGFEMSASGANVLEYASVANALRCSTSSGESWGSEGSETSEDEIVYASIVQF